MRLWHIVPAFGCSAAIVACGFADVFKSPAVGTVVLTYTGPTTVVVNDRFPVSVSVTVNGTPLFNPRVSASASDTVLTVVPQGDTVVAVGMGFDTLTIKLVASIFTDSFPTIKQRIRVNP